MNSTPVGSYIYDDTFVHRLDPRVKLVANIVYIVMTFLSLHFATLAILFIPLLILHLLGTKNIKSVFKLLKMPLLVGFFVFFVNIYTMKNTPETDYKPFLYIFGSSTYALSYGVIARTLSLVFRIYIMIMSTNLFVTTTKPILLTKAIEDLMLPLKLLFIPTHIIAMIISVALRFIPTLLIEAKRIIKAQASRGVDFVNGKIKDKAKAFTTLIIPLFSTSFAKAEDLSNAMETRGYDPYSKRTRYRLLIPTWRDLIVSIVLIGLLVLTVLIKKDMLELTYLYNLTSFAKY
ncbi:cobalt ABC transporter permease protein [Mycoplasmopsis californica HAZ160_1]|uniref:Cobalt ABC transporter permease n=2 Tax=Mycoplasmopsis californica TaxID=2113 RepID=A0A059XQW5_9BACT|nr:energy-coupling factor transporter transmembrane component T [Mycoplasmopsis californica]AIA29440.1 cobalt ABC transporter permease [Mycoplasmopsis californica]BAP01111.1 cobalt ABC transporter permease protein [Mycoplasmopsis californica HAZ160_1]BBG40977.1 cobalt ABC transporter permease protein [Mycoplasmopsis californica]BBG41570.1 cobalt ABC transporter permease protein [Mycoplasmopsis californica]BBG42164.1 cobalt ABC transporter permease protein [Mycoplasmopsis californica]